MRAYDAKAFERSTFGNFQQSYKVQDGSFQEQESLLHILSC